MARVVRHKGTMMTQTSSKKTLIIAILASALFASSALAQQPRDVRPRSTQSVKRIQHNPLRKLPYAHRTYAAGLLVKKHFNNQYGTDGALLSAVGKKAMVKPKGFNDSALKQLTTGLTTKQQQVFALNTLVRDSKSDTLMSAAVSKLGEMGDASSFSAMKWALTKGGEKTIPEVAKAVNKIGARDSKFAPERRVLDLAAIKNPRDQVEAVLKGGAIESIKPLSTDNHHAFDTYLVTFKNKVNGNTVKGVFKPTGPKHAENWLRYSQDLNGRKGAYSFMSREVYAYKLDKMLGTNLVPPTSATAIKVPGAGTVMGSVQYFMPGSKAIGNTWDKTRPEFKDFEKSPAGVRQMDTMRTFSWIMSSVEHVPTSLMGGNKGNVLVAHTKSSGFPVGISTPGTGKRLMLIDNASAHTHKQYLSDNVLPQRFEKSVINKLQGLDKGTFMNMATKYLGDHEANWAWGRIQHTLTVAKTRPTYE